MRRKTDHAGIDLAGYTELADNGNRTVNTKELLNKSIQDLSEGANKKM